MRAKKNDELVEYLTRHPDVLEHGTPYEKDLTVPCPCGAKAGRACKELPTDKVHIARRLKRLLMGVR